MRRSRSSSLILGTLLAFLGVEHARGQSCPTCDFRDRGDRFEGVEGRLHSGGCCEVLGVERIRAEKLDPKDTATLYLHFPVPEQGTLGILVRNPASNYMMAPKEQLFHSGWGTFSWPRAEVVAKLRLPLEELDVRVTGPGDVYLPALLSTSREIQAFRGYAFKLESGDGFEADGSVERIENGLASPLRSFKVTRNAGSFTLEWDGRDRGGQPAPPGLYLLRLKGTLDAERPEDFDFTLLFRHDDPRP